MVGVAHHGEAEKGHCTESRWDRQIHFSHENWIEPLTEATVYPDTIWREKERNGEIK